MMSICMLKTRNIFNFLKKYLVRIYCVNNVCLWMQYLDFLVLIGCFVFIQCLQGILWIKMAVCDWLVMRLIYIMMDTCC